jgi:hypothetical protein
MSLENPVPGGQTPPVGAQHPVYPPYPVYPQYPGYAPYPDYRYTGAPQPGQAPFVPVPAAVLPPVPARAPDKPRRQRISNLVVAIVLAAVTVGALALAAAAPTFVTHDPGVPTGNGYSQVYNAALHSDPTTWNVTSGCEFAYGGQHTLGGLHAVSGSDPTLCDFLPSRSTDYVSGGFYLTTQIAPPGAVASEEAACVLLASTGSTVSFAIDQNGSFAFNTDSSYACSTAPGPGQFPRGTAAWHGSGYVPNTLSLGYNPNSHVMTAYLNGQQIGQLSVDLSGQYTISLGTPPTGNDTGGNTTYEVIYTSFGLWSTASS